MSNASVPEQINLDQNDQKYFASYDDLEIHRLMLKDEARVKAYKEAIEVNSHLFRNKIILDVGAGTGILSLLCAKAGARRVIAAEAAPGMASLVEKVAHTNGFENIINVFSGRVEDMKENDVTGGVDIIVSEWMGFYLFHESMLASVLWARDNLFSATGSRLMFPCLATLYCAPVFLPTFREEKISFWKNVYGFDMSPIGKAVSLISTERPEIMTIDQSQLISNPQLIRSFDLSSVSFDEISLISDRRFVSVDRDADFDGLAIWFTCEFCNWTKAKKVVLSTGPENSYVTHWKQTVVVMPENITVEENEIIGWELIMKQHENNFRSYSIEFSLLDPESDQHPVPCACLMSKCALINALYQKSDKVETKES